MALKFPSWPNKSSRIDTIHRKIVSTVKCINCQCVSHLVLLSQLQGAIFQSVVLFANIVVGGVLCSRSKESDNRSCKDLGPLDQIN